MSTEGRREVISKPVHRLHGTYDLPLVVTERLGWRGRRYWLTGLVWPPASTTVHPHLPVVVVVARQHEERLGDAGVGDRTAVTLGLE